MQIPSWRESIVREAPSPKQGRGTHSYQTGHCCFPNDATEQDRLDMIHLVSYRLLDAPYEPRRSQLSIPIRHYPSKLHAWALPHLFMILMGSSCHCALQAEPTLIPVVLLATGRYRLEDTILFSRIGRVPIVRSKGSILVQ